MEAFSASTRQRKSSALRRDVTWGNAMRFQEFIIPATLPEMVQEGICSALI
jgi:hypothetical protein